MELSDTRHVTIGEDSLAAEDGESTTLCTGCDWHFALRLSAAGTDTGRLVWGRHPHPGHGGEYGSEQDAPACCLRRLLLTHSLCRLHVQAAPDLLLLVHSLCRLHVQAAPDLLLLVHSLCRLHVQAAPDLLLLVHSLCRLHVQAAPGCLL